jgi:predicted dehydrogenase
MRHALVGCGGIGGIHARVLGHLEGSVISVLCDVVRERADDYAQRYGGRAVYSLDDVLAADDVDLIHICTPSGMHADQAVACLQANKHVIIEKSSAKATCIFQNRFLFGCEQAKAVVESGKLGKLVMGDSYLKWYRSQAYYDSGEWRATWELDGGGCLMNQGVHYVDLVQWLMGPVQSVYAICDTLSHDIVVEDCAAAVLRYANGAIGVIEATTSAAPGLDWRIEIQGDQGSVSLRNGNIEHWRFLDKELDRQAPAEEAPLQAAGSDPRNIPDKAHLAQIDGMRQAIWHDLPVPVPVHEARNAVEIIRAIYQSSRTGQPVTLPLAE